MKAINKVVENSGDLKSSAVIAAINKDSNDPTFWSCKLGNCGGYKAKRIFILFYRYPYRNLIYMRTVTM